jgi:hypothetical protein
MATAKKSKPSELRAYIDELNDLPTDVLLGRIVLFTITDEPIRRDDMVKWFRDLDLDEAYLPAPNKYLDAFKKATSDTKDTYPMSKDRTGNLLCREVSSTPNYITRQITREVKDGGKRRLSYTEAITCTFYRPTKADDQSAAHLRVQVNPTNLEKGELTLVQQVAKDIVSRYHDYYDFLDGQKVRGCIRSYLKKLNAIEIKGGVYFVHSSRDDELARVADLVSRFGGGCHMNMIPMVDLERERAFMAKVFEREASQSLRDLTREVDELLSTRKSITPAAYAKLQARYDEVLNNATEHMENLQVNQDVTAAAAEVAHEALRGLREAMLDD